MALPQSLTNFDAALEAECLSKLLPEEKASALVALGKERRGKVLIFLCRSELEALLSQFEYGGSIKNELEVLLAEDCVHGASEVLQNEARTLRGLEDNKDRKDFLKEFQVTEWPFLISGMKIGEILNIIEEMEKRGDDRTELLLCLSKEGQAEAGRILFQGMTPGIITVELRNNFGTKAWPALTSGFDLEFLRKMSVYMMLHEQAVLFSDRIEYLEEEDVIDMFSGQHVTSLERSKAFIKLSDEGKMVFLKKLDKKERRGMAACLTKDEVIAWPNYFQGIQHPKTDANGDHHVSSIQPASISLLTGEIKAEIERQKLLNTGGIPIKYMTKEGHVIDALLIGFHPNNGNDDTPPSSHTVTTKTDKEIVGDEVFLELSRIDLEANNRKMIVVSRRREFNEDEKRWEDVIVKSVIALYELLALNPGLDKIIETITKGKGDETMISLAESPKIYDGKGAETLAASIESFEEPDGSMVAFATSASGGRYISGKELSADRVIVGKEFTGVVDGMGGQGNDEMAAEVISEALVTTYDMSKIPVQIKQSLDRDERLKNGNGACFATSKFIPGVPWEAMICGDIDVYFFEPNGNCSFRPGDELMVGQPPQSALTFINQLASNPKLEKNIIKKELADYLHIVCDGRFSEPQLTSEINRIIERALNEEDPLIHQDDPLYTILRSTVANAAVKGNAAVRVAKITQLKPVRPGSWEVKMSDGIADLFAPAELGKPGEFEKMIRDAIVLELNPKEALELVCDEADRRTKAKAEKDPVAIKNHWKLDHGAIVIKRAGPAHEIIIDEAPATKKEPREAA